MQAVASDGLLLRLFARAITQFRRQFSAVSRVGGVICYARDVKLSALNGSLSQLAASRLGNQTERCRLNAVKGHVHANVDVGRSLRGTAYWWIDGEVAAADEP